MGKFRRISTELLPFIRVENWFSCSISLIFGRLSSNFVYELIFIRSGLGLKILKNRPHYSIKKIRGLLTEYEIKEIKHQSPLTPNKLT